MVIVDEVQDLKASEWDMVNTMMKKAKTVYLAGTMIKLSMVGVERKYQS